MTSNAEQTPGCDCASRGEPERFRHSLGCPYSKSPPPAKLMRAQRDEYQREADRYRTALTEARKLIDAALDEGNFA